MEEFPYHIENSGMSETQTDENQKIAGVTKHKNRVEKKVQQNTEIKPTRIVDYEVREVIDEKWSRRINLLLSFAMLARLRSSTDIIANSSILSGIDEFDTIQETINNESKDRISFPGEEENSFQDSNTFNSKTELESDKYHTLDYPTSESLFYYENADELISILPKSKELEEFKLIERKEVNKNLKIDSNFIQMFTIAKEGQSDDITSITSIIDLDLLLQHMNKYQYKDWKYNFDKLDGLIFKIKDRLTLSDQNGRILELGEIWGSDYSSSFVVLSYTDENTNYHSFFNEKIDNLDQKKYGKDPVWGDFDIINRLVVLREILGQNPYQMLDSQEIRLPIESVNGIHSTILNSNEVSSSSFISQIYNEVDINALERIAEYDKSIKVVLGLIKAIKQYQNDNITKESLEKLFKNNYEDFHFEPIGLEEHLDIEDSTLYLLNYLDTNGDSWYRDFLEIYRDDYNYSTQYLSKEELITDLNLVLNLSISNPNKEVINSYALFNVIDKLVSLNSVKLSSLPVESYKEILPDDFQSYSGQFYPLQVARENGVEKGGYIYRETDFKTNVNLLERGDIILFPNSGKLNVDTGENIGQAILVIHKRVLNPKSPDIFVLEVNKSGKGEIEISNLSEEDLLDRECYLIRNTITHKQLSN